MRVLRGILLVLAATAIVVVGMLAVFVVGVRSRHPGVLRITRILQRDYLNPAALRDAGRPGSPHSVIRHVGRTSGREYETPIAVVGVDGGFVIALVYGEDAQWVRNVRAGGASSLLHEGRAYSIDAADVVPIESTPLRSATVTNRVFRIESALRLRTTPLVR